MHDITLLDAHQPHIFLEVQDWQVVKEEHSEVGIGEGVIVGTGEGVGLGLSQTTLKLPLLAQSLWVEHLPTLLAE